MGDIAPTATTDPGETLLAAPLRDAEAFVALAARRQPQRGRSVEKRRSQARSSASSAVSGGGVSRWVERCKPTVRHARRSDTPHRGSILASTSHVGLEPGQVQ